MSVVFLTNQAKMICICRDSNRTNVIIRKQACRRWTTTDSDPDVFLLYKQATQKLVTDGQTDSRTNKEIPMRALMGGSKSPEYVWFGWSKWVIYVFRKDDFQIILTS